MINPTKFGSQKLDTPNLRYEFLKHALKSRKINQKFKSSQTDSWGPRVNRARVSLAQGRAPVLTGRSSLMASSPTTAPAPLDSSQLSTRNGVDGWADYRSQGQRRC